MVTHEYAIAYKEVLEILKYVSVEEFNKIPKEKVNLFEKNQDKAYKIKYNPSMTLNEQNISKRAQAIIAILFRDYWATDIQREKIIKKENYDKMIIEKNKREKYNVDNIFRNSEIEKKNNDTVSLVKIDNVNWYKKIFSNLKRIFFKS